MANGKQMTQKVVALVLALVIGAILIGNVLPVGINATTEDSTINLTQDEGTEYVVVDGKLNSTVTGSDTTTDPDQTTIELKDVESGNTVSNTVENGSTVTYSIGGESVNVTVNDVTSGTPSTVDVTYSVPPDYGWDDGTQSLWTLIPVFLVLGALVLLAGIVLRQM